MPTLRRTWLALVGGALLLAFSVSAAFGAPPTEEDGPRGQSVSAFVHELIFGSEPADEDQDEDADEEVVDEEQEDADDTTREVPEEFANHGECVSEAAHDQEGFEESDALNRGEWVSMHARYTCWGLEPPDEETDETDTDVTDEEGDTDGATAKEERKAAKEAAKAEREAAREAAKAEREAAKAERRAGKGH
jgi:hypothetical protein